MASQSTSGQPEGPLASRIIVQVDQEYPIPAAVAWSVIGDFSADWLSLNVDEVAKVVRERKQQQQQASNLGGTGMPSNASNSAQSPGFTNSALINSILVETEAELRSTDPNAGKIFGELTLGRRDDAKRESNTIPYFSCVLLEGNSRRKITQVNAVDATATETELFESFSHFDESSLGTVQNIYDEKLLRTDPDRYYYSYSREAPGFTEVHTDAAIAQAERRKELRRQERLAARRKQKLHQLQLQRQQQLQQQQNQTNKAGSSANPTATPTLESNSLASTDAAQTSLLQQDGDTDEFNTEVDTNPTDGQNAAGLDGLDGSASYADALTTDTDDSLPTNDSKTNLRTSTLAEEAALELIDVNDDSLDLDDDDDDDVSSVAYTYTNFHGTFKVIPLDFFHCKVVWEVGARPFIAPIKPTLKQLTRQIADQDHNPPNSPLDISAEVDGDTWDSVRRDLEYRFRSQLKAGMLYVDAALSPILPRLEARASAAAAAGGSAVGEYATESPFQIRVPESNTPATFAKVLARQWAAILPDPTQGTEKDPLGLTAKLQALVGIDATPQKPSDDDATLRGARATIISQKVLPTVVQGLSELLKVLEKEEAKRAAHIERMKLYPMTAPYRPLNPLHWLAGYLCQHTGSNVDDVVKNPSFRAYEQIFTAILGERLESMGISQR